LGGHGRGDQRHGGALHHPAAAAVVPGILRCQPPVLREIGGCALEVPGIGERKHSLGRGSSGRFGPISREKKCRIHSGSNFHIGPATGGGGQPFGLALIS